jgi:hypothetical protein
MGGETAKGLDREGVKVIGEEKGLSIECRTSSTLSNGHPSPSTY